MATTEVPDREAQCCGHVFQTVRQRRTHEQRVERGERVLCPCGDVCSEPPACDDCGEHHEGYGECPLAGAEGSTT